MIKKLTEINKLAYKLYLIDFDSAKNKIIYVKIKNERSPVNISYFLKYPKLFLKYYKKSVNIIRKDKINKLIKNVYENI